MTAPNTTHPDQLPPHYLPFSVDEKSFSIWLSQAVKQGDVELLQLQADTLNKLKKTAIPTDIRAAFLEKIENLIFKVSKQLQKSYIDSYFPFSEDDTLKIKLSMRCAFEMAENYALVCKDPGFKLKTIFTQEQKAIILLNSIQAMSNILLYKAVLYERAGKGFWSLCYLFYLFAKKNDVLQLKPSHCQAGFIEIFKQLIVLELSNTQQFNTKEIYTVFNLLSSLTEQVKLLPSVPEKMLHSVPCINLRSDKPPSIFKDKIAEEPAHIFYISNLNLVKQLFALSANKKNLPYQDKILILRLIKALARKQSRKNERRLADNELQAEVGLDKALEFLLHQESLSKTKGVIQYEARELTVEQELLKHERDEIYGYRTEFDASLSLAKEEADDVVEYLDNSDIWKEEEKKQVVIEKDQSDSNANLIDQSKFGFCLKLKEKGVVTKVGAIVRLFIHSVSVMTVIRRIIARDREGVIIGVEVLGYDAELLHIMDIDNKGPRMACIIVNIEGVESIIIKADEFQNEDYLYVDRNEKILRYKIEKVLDSSTSMIKHLKVSQS